MSSPPNWLEDIVLHPISTFLSLAWSSLTNKSGRHEAVRRGEDCSLARREDQGGTRGFLGKSWRERERWQGSSYSRQKVEFRKVTPVRTRRLLSKQHPENAKCERTDLVSTKDEKLPTCFPVPPEVKQGVGQWARGSLVWACNRERDQVLWMQHFTFRLGLES